MLDELLDDKGIVGLALKDSNFISILVLVILLLMSSLSWAVIVLKALQFRKTSKQNQEFLLIFRKETSLNQIKESIPKFPFSTFAPMYRLAFEEMVRVSQRISGILIRQYQARCFLISVLNLSGLWSALSMINML